MTATLPSLPPLLQQIAAQIVKRARPDADAVRGAVDALKPGHRQHFGLIERRPK